MNVVKHRVLFQKPYSVVQGWMTDSKVIWLLCTDNSRLCVTISRMRFFRTATCQDITNNCLSVLFYGYWNRPIHSKHNFNHHIPIVGLALAYKISNASTTWGAISFFLDSFIYYFLVDMQTADHLSLSSIRQACFTNPVGCDTLHNARPLSSTTDRVLCVYK